MKKEEKEYIVTEIQKCNNYIKSNNMKIISCTFFALVSVFDIIIAHNLLAIKILGPLFLSGSLFTIGYSIYDKIGLNSKKQNLINKLKYDKLKSSYHYELGDNIENLHMGEEMINFDLEDYKSKKLGSKKNK